MNQVLSTSDKPHGIDYTLTMHGADGERLVGFDNAHQVTGQKKGAARDHKHRLRTVRPYDYMDAATLLGAFWKEVESVMRKKELGREDTQGRNCLLRGHEGAHDGHRQG